MHKSQENFETFKAKVKVYLEAQRYDAAEKLVKNAIEEIDDAAHLWHLLGLVYHKQSKFVEAVSAFRQAIKINPTFIEASLNLAVTLCDLSQYEEAFQIFEELKRQNDFQRQLPRLVLGRISNLHVKAAQHYDEVGMLTEAVQEYRRALTLFPQLTQARLSLARLYLKANEPHKAKAEVEETLRQTGEDADALTLLGVIEHSLGHQTQAQDAWTRAQRLAPEDPTSRILLNVSTNLSETPSL